MSFGDIHIEFENSPIKTRFIKPVKLRVCGKDLEASAGAEMELLYWIAMKLFEAGLAKPADSMRMDLIQLSKIHWRETVPATRQISAVGRDFYFKMREYLSELRAASRADGSKLMELEKAMGLFEEILNCRIRKILSIAAAGAESEEALKNLTPEERLLLEDVRSGVMAWKGFAALGGDAK
ncbi:MAG: hypothetical protein QXW19_01225 [Candidatus Bathyarchaeia archaeon]